MIFEVLGVLIVAYLIGSIPFGWIIVKIATGRDVRSIESGRTGGTNVMRAAGVLAGALTALLDVGKGALTVWLVRWILGDSGTLLPWLEVAAPLGAILGHNYSIYLLERHETTGKMRLRGGAGGATCLGGAIGLWPSSALFILPLALIAYLVIGYASVTTMSIAFSATIVFIFTYFWPGLPWQYILYGLIAEAMLIWALRPNIERLRQGNERMHGIRVWLKNRKTAH